MFKIKNIQVGTYENYYKQNIQLQFLNDDKFTAFMQYLCGLGGDEYTYVDPITQQEVTINGYQQVLKNFNDALNFDKQSSSDYPQVDMLNAIGRLLGLPPITHFRTQIGIAGNTISVFKYILLIKASQLKNQWDGTNASIISLLNTLFPEYTWRISDNGTMNIDIYMIQKDNEHPIDADIQYFFENGWLTPKPLGVSVNYRTVTEDFFTWDSTVDTEKWDNGVWA